MIVRIFACLWFVLYLSLRPFLWRGRNQWAWRLKRSHRNITHRRFADKFRDPCED
jgi:hypothetical protein